VWAWGQGRRGAWLSWAARLTMNCMRAWYRVYVRPQSHPWTGISSLPAFALGLGAGAARRASARAWGKCSRHYPPRSARFSTLSASLTPKRLRDVGLGLWVAEGLGRGAGAVAVHRCHHL